MRSGLRITSPALAAVLAIGLAGPGTATPDPPQPNASRALPVLLAGADGAQGEPEAAAVDPRLARKVTLHVKAVSLGELCRQLSTLTGVKIQAGRGIADENATVLVREQPARGVMRAVGRLFKLYWSRTGEAGAYRYELVQDLRSQLEEDDLRTRDLHGALLALDAQMSAMGPLLELGKEQLRAREKKATGAEKARIDNLLRNWGTYQVYARLTPAQRLKLANGESLEFESGAPDPERRLPDELRRPLLEGAGTIVEHQGKPTLARVDPRDGTPLTEVPDAVATVRLSIAHSELGEARLLGGVGGYVPSRPELGRLGGESLVPAAIGRSPSSSRPENAKRNASLRSRPEFQKRITLAPVSSCPVFKPGASPRRARTPSYVDTNGLPQLGTEPPHVFSADVWEAVHEQTGMAIVADAYTRVFPRDAVSLKSGTLFDALCHAGDQMGAQWRQDGEYLLVRSTRYFWEKLKEVPKRDLDRWREERVEHHGLPLADLLEIARLRDEQVNSAVIGKVVEHCYGVEEWGLVGNSGFRMGTHYTELLPFARVLASLTPAQLAGAGTPPGLRFIELPLPARDLVAARLARFRLGPEFLDGMRFRYQYVPAGRYVWVPESRDPAREQQALRRLVVSGGTADEALAAARRLDPAAEPGEIHRSAGVLEFTLEAGDGRVWKLGEPR